MLTIGRIFLLLLFASFFSGIENLGCRADIHAPLTLRQGHMRSKYVIVVYVLCPHYHVLSRGTSSDTIPSATTVLVCLQNFRAGNMYCPFSTLYTSMKCSLPCGLPLGKLARISGNFHHKSALLPSCTHTQRDLCDFRKRKEDR